MDDDAIRALVTRLSRSHPSGGEVIERAAILAEGADFATVEQWIIAHDGQPEMRPTKAAGGGLYGTRAGEAAEAKGPPVRYVLPAGALA
jgi:hypothetical protein